MPKRTDIRSILIIGAGPIVIGQGCEFDYSGTQACKALKEEGYKVILVNSNPATIMTDPEMADRTYIEPITVEAVTKIIEKERPDALLPTLGGQTGLNTAIALYDAGVLKKYNVQMIGADREAIRRGEDRSVFKALMEKIGLQCPKSGLAHSMDDARNVVKETGLPCIIRASFTLGGTGSGIAYNMEEFETLAQRGLDASMITEIQIDQSLIGWKEYELEVMRDKADNVVIVCSIENFDPMGVHTGDSITVAPQQTLTDKEYQRMRDASIAIIRAVGVETGGSNIQFGVNPKTGDIVVIEMNPRVSRSSALASKATGFPIAKLAAKLAVGYTLDELPNDITKKTVACFEPSIDYVVVKIPRWTFEKFPDADETLTTQMKSVGEAMSIGRTFKEALQKGIRSMEVKRFGLGLDKIDKWWKAQCVEQSTSSPGIAIHGLTPAPTTDIPSPDKPAKTLGDRGSDMTRVNTQEQAAAEWPIPEEELHRKLAIPSQGRLYYIRYAFKMGRTVDDVFKLTNIDPWFLTQMKELVDFENELVMAAAKVKPTLREVNPGHSRIPTSNEHTDFRFLFRRAKEWGYSDVQLATVFGMTPQEIRKWRSFFGIEPVYKLVDTCAAEFEAATPYYYSTYESPIKKIDPKAPHGNAVAVLSTPTTFVDDEIRITPKKKIIILGGGPNRIGQGIEFDYCCVQAAFAAKELGFESVMINSNPETVSTDYDTSDLLFFEPLTHEDVLNIVERLNGQPLMKDVSSSESAKTLIQNALKAAGIVEVTLNVELNLATVVVNDDQLSLAIGKDGQNVRSAARLTSLDIDVVTPAQYNKGLDDLEKTLKSIENVNEQMLDQLAELGVVNLQHVEELGAERLAKKLEISQELADKVAKIAAQEAKRIAAENVLSSVERLNDAPLQSNLRDATVRERSPGLVAGVIVQFGGQTPLNLARGLKDAGVPIIGTAVESIEAAEDREKFNALVKKLNLKQPNGGMARSAEQAREVAKKIGYPVLVRPSFVLGGRAMEIVSDEDQLNYYIQNAVEVAEEHPVLIDSFLGDATEMDVDCIGDGTDYLVCGLMEHIEEAGIHSGDSACSLPPFSLPQNILDEVRRNTLLLAKELKVVGLMNVQFAIKDGEVFILEVNPRASRTVPFVSKATGVSWARIAAKVMMGKTLKELGITGEVVPTDWVAVKESVFPFNKFPGVDIILGPEMRSTGEVMGIDKTFPLAFAKSQMAAGGSLPTSGTIYLSVRDADKPAILPVAKKLADLGFNLLATGGTHKALADAGINAERVNKIKEGRPNIIDAIKNKQVALLINTPTTKGPKTDEGQIRAAAVMHKIPIITTLTAAEAAADAMQALKSASDPDNPAGWSVRPLQDYYGSANPSK